MADEYQAPDPNYAEFADRMERECRQQEARLKGATPDEAWRIASDRGESQAARMNAMAILFRHRDPRIPRLQLDLLEDPQQDLWIGLAPTYRTDSPPLRAALHKLIADSDCRKACYAAEILARFRDESILPTVRAWLSHPERERRCSALATFHSFPGDSGMSELERLWDEGWGDFEDRLALAIDLTSRGHAAARHHTTVVAERAQGAWATACATQIYFIDPRAGLKLMLNLCDAGDLDARQAMVGQVSSLAGGLPHAYTYDGLSETRLWIEQQLSSLDHPDEPATASRDLEIRLRKRGCPASH